ncbi:MAG: hypothetical protein CVV42_09665 [Candidatus Riflebacteria bacterium HGW-Riflebacteria-2]|jgi:hypothetical protein|nr:MAG: hypothetical protein CVV42_09665 [Candidatus Riflebacteria bacterium HGW-Riflebacteria-2]
MQLRFWGGWFLAIAGLVIMLSMGCEKGALGVKPAMITGRIVRADNDTVGIAFATVRVMSKEALGTSELKQGKNFLSTVTDADGYFVFENVIPDNVLVEYQKGQNKATYPSTTTSSQTDDGTTAESAKLEAVFVKSGDIINLGSLPLTEVTKSLPPTALIKLDLYSTYNNVAQSAVKVQDLEEFYVTINGEPLQDALGNTKLTAAALRAGIERESAEELEIAVRHADDPPLYTPMVMESVELLGSEYYGKIVLSPVTYKLQLRWVNAPDYLDGASANIIVETNAAPAHVLTTTSLVVANDALPNIVQVSAINLPVSLRIQMLGYEDEVIRIDSSLTAFGGSEGNYRIDVDFTDDNAKTEFVYNPNVAADSKAGMYDNIISRDVVFQISGADLLVGDRVTANLSLPYDPAKIEVKDRGDGAWIPSVDNPVIVTTTGEAFIKFNAATGHNFAYQVVIDPGLGNASPTFVISEHDESKIPVPETATPTVHTVIVDAARP